MAGAARRGRGLPPTAYRLRPGKIGIMLVMIYKHSNNSIKDGNAHNDDNTITTTTTTTTTTTPTTTNNNNNDIHNNNNHHSWEASDWPIASAREK